MKKYLWPLLLALASTGLHAQDELPTPGTMDNYTYFVFSQTGLTVADTQIFHVSPDMIIRGWAKWDTYGTHASDYDFSILTRYHRQHIPFIGGMTTTVYFFDEAADSAEFLNMVTYNASGDPVRHHIVGSDNYRANIANPAFRDYLVRISKIQIDGGVDGLCFDEVISGYDGKDYNGNEGFDDYTLADFNTFLLEKYPEFTKSNWVRTFGMSGDNYPDKARPVNDLEGNFNYRKYLACHGWQDDPLNPSNPLAAEWGHVVDNRADTVSNTFLAKYTTRYWRDIVARVRQYARDSCGREILITSNGLFPYVDFNELGMYDGNKDDNGAEAPYVPVTGGHLRGDISLGEVFNGLYRKNAAIAGQVPLILFIDWPTPMMSAYENLPLPEKKDYWKIYAAEAYANGIFMAFHLGTAMPGDPTAAEQGLLDFMRDYPSFYREHAQFYHHNRMLDLPVGITAAKINFSLMGYEGSGRQTIHLVNHNYSPGKGMTEMKKITVSLPLESAPGKVYMISPDFPGSHPLVSVYRNGTLYVTLDHLEYYGVIVLDP